MARFDITKMTPISMKGIEAVVSRRAGKDTAEEISMVDVTYRSRAAAARIEPTGQHYMSVNIQRSK